MSLIFILPLIFLAVFMTSSQGRPSRHLTQGIGGQIVKYLKTKEWIVEETEGKISGNVTLVMKYNIPLDMEFTLPRKGAESCYSILKKHGSSQSGVYTITPDGATEVQTFCDMDTASGGWTVFQRRQDGTIDFYRTWQEYKAGFGNSTGEYWLGNDHLHHLTNRGGMCELYISMISWNNVEGHARYKNFSIEDESNLYRLHIGNYSGTAGKDSLRYHNNMKFGTKDNDNDNDSISNCATNNDHGAWWYNDCDQCGLNGLYDNTSSDKGIEWDGFPGGSRFMKFTKMMVRCT